MMTTRGRARQTADPSDCRSLPTEMLAAMIISCSNMANAQSLKDLLGKLGGSGDTSETIGNLLEGVFSSSNLSVQDLKGNWLATGPAVAFQGDNFLKQLVMIIGQKYALSLV